MFCMVLLVGSVSAVTYTPTTETTCDSYGLCTQTIYSGTQFVFEDDVWKNWDEARSLKDKGFEINYLETDKDYPLEVIDFNATSITVKLNPKGFSIFTKNVPIRIWTPNDLSIKDDFKETYDKVVEEEISFWLLNQKEIITYDFNLGKILEFGPNSTTITLDYTYVIGDAEIQEGNPNNNYGGDASMQVGKDGSGDDYNSLIKWNITDLKDTVIISAILSLYAGNIDGELQVIVYNTSNDWYESNVTYNNAPALIGAGMETYYIDSGDDLKYLNYTITTIISEDVNLNHLSSSMRLEGSFDSSDEWASFHTKEGTYKPLLYVTFNIQIGTTITFPIEGTDYEYLPTYFNWSIDNNTVLDECWYSLNDAANVTTTCLDYGEMISSIEGNNNIIFYANNTVGFLNSSMVSYTADIPFPSVSITHPENIIYGSNRTTLNYTYVSDYADECWFSIDKGVTNSSSQVCGTNWSGMIGYEGVNNWTVFINSTSVNDEQGRDDVVFTIDLTAPALNITYPINYVDYQIYNENLTFTWTYSDDNPSMCWYDYSGTNVTVDCDALSAQINTTDLTNTDLIMYANDTVPVMVFDTTSWEYKVLQNYITYDSTSYEMLSTNYVLNISSTGSESVSASLFYDGVEYPSTKTGTNYEMLFSNSLYSIPYNLGYKPFYWNVSYGGEGINTNTYYQWRNASQIGICNATITVPYINLSFKDEESGLTMNATIDASTWEYWLGDGSYTKSLTYSNTALNYNYTFCFIPGTEILHNTRSIQYAAPGYPQRKYYSSDDLTNSLLNQTLYLLATGDGIYTTIHVINQNIVNVIGAEVTVERQFDGVWTVVGKDTTDDSGSVTFWVNPDYSHRFTFTADGCTGAITTIRPTQTFYTQQLSCELEDERPIYISPYFGITYHISPKDGTWLNEDTIYHFTFNISANESNLITYSINITDIDMNQLNSSMGTTAIGSNLTVAWDTTGYDKVYAHYYIQITNGTGVYLIDPGMFPVHTIEPGRNSMLVYFQNMMASPVDIADTYTRLTLMFFLIFVGFAAFCRSTGMELAQPGITLFIVFFLVLALSILGFLQIDFSPSAFMNQYGVCLVIFFLVTGYSLGQWGRT